ncbi:MAG TPA: cytochrome P450 [Symbiobacteriaceae bacterium]|nr:cytochrome P450 [Symbiobacteriaceae bacterium]
MFQTPEQKLNPFAFYARMRAEQPVAFFEAAQAWGVFRYDDVRSVLQNHAVFSSNNSDMLNTKNPSLIFSDPPRHTHLRNLVNRAFTSAAVARLEPRIQELADELVSKVTAQGRMDVVADLAVPLPVAVIAEMLGIPRKDQAQFKDWSDQHMAAISPGRKADVSLAYLAEMDAYFGRILEYRRQNPGDDLLTGLLEVEADGDRLTEKDILNFARLLLVAGNETTTNLIGNAVLCFLDFPEQLALLRANPELMPSAVEEALRYRSPVVTMPRVAKQDFELGGQVIKAGQRVMPLMAAANHDVAKFANPGQFDITRDPNPHLAFGHGVHFCLGAPLARLEARIALATLLRYAQQIERDGNEPLEPVNGLVANGVKRLPIRFH